MATDATGTPTPLGIPKFNVNADAPSGLGSNAQMDAIDTLIADRVLKPAGIVSGEVSVWNGTTWVRSSVTKIDAINVGGAWTTYTPTLVVGGVTVTLGNGVLESAFVRVGKTVEFRIRFVFGSTTAGGSGWPGGGTGVGGLSFSLPVTGLYGAYYPIGSAFYLDNGVGFYTDYAPVMESTTTVIPRFNNASAGHNVPVVPATGDTWWITGTYEAA